MEVNSRTSLEKRYVWYQAFRRMWLVGAIWLLYYRLFISDQQVGILDAIAFSVGLLAEVPAGALADRFGRKRLVGLGIILESFGIGFQGLVHSYALILIGQAMLMIGISFCSGADDSLFYDALHYDEGSTSWKKLYIRGGQAGLVATLVCYIVGAYLFKISPSLPFVTQGFVMILALLSLWGIKENRNNNDEKKSFSSYLLVLKDGVKQLTHTRAVMYVPLILTVQGMFYTFGFGLLRPILQTRFGFGAAAGGWLLFACGVLTVLLQRWQHAHIENFSERRAITSIACVTILALIAAIFHIGLVGGVVIATIYASEYLLDPWVNDGINKHITSQHRATALSAASFLKGMPYVIAAPLVGYLNVHGNLNYYLIGITLLSYAALLKYRSSTANA